MYLSGLSHEKGERSIKYDELPEFLKVISEASLPNMQALWGWGYFNKIDDLFSLIKNSIENTLRNSINDPSKIDTLIISSSYLFFTFEEFSVKLGKILRDLNFKENLDIRVVVLNGCATTHRAVSQAQELIENELIDSALLLSIAFFSSDMPRFRQYAIMSESVVSFYLGKEEHQKSFRLLSLENKSYISQMQYGVAVAIRQQAIKDVVNESMNKIGLTAKDITKIFTNNIFKPLAEMKLKYMGFPASSYSLGGIEKYGHSPNNDSFIQLYEHIEDRKSAINGEVYLLQADSEGFCSSMILRN